MQLANHGVRVWIALASTMVVASYANVASAARFPKSAEDVLVVDCLLPGQVRKLGRINSFLSQRRPARLSQFECGLRGGEYVEYDRASLKSSLDVWQGAAMAGDPDAMVMLGEAFAKGLGTAPDYEQAAIWFKRAGAKGDKRALQNLGTLYELGLGVTADREQALELYRRASGVTGERLVFTSTLANETELAEKLERAELARQRLASERDQLAAKLQAAQRALASKRAEVEALKRKAASAPDPAAVQAMWLVLEEQIKAGEREIAAGRQQIVDLETRLVGAPNDTVAQAQVGLNSLQRVQLGTLALQLSSPKLIASRGAPTAWLGRSESRLRIAGHLQPASTQTKLFLDAQELPLGTGGSFSADLAVPDGARLKLMAQDDEGRRAQFEFVALAPANVATGPQADFSLSVAQQRLSWPKSLVQAKRRMLLIGNRHYQHYPELGSPMDDVDALAAVLRKHYGYSGEVLRNANRLDMLLALERLRQESGSDDDVLIFYAGHGELKATQGAWVPIDGKADQPQSWIANRVIADFLARMPARNVVVVADSCYAGTLSSTAMPALSETLASQDWQAWAAAAGAGRSRLALSSGGVRPVFDAAAGSHSLFTQALLAVLQRKRAVLPVQTLYAEVSDWLVLRARDGALSDLPTLAPIQFAGHEQGELLFAQR